jgi:uncharacterized membrane protein (DUF2068 family)
MSGPGAIPAMLRGKRRARYLKIIGLFKIGQSLLLFSLGISLLVLHSRTLWLDAISDWVDGELMAAHSRTVMYLLNRLQEVVTGGFFQVTGWIAIFFGAVLGTAGIGVYLQKTWAEYLLLIATAALIPLEVRHAWLHPGLVVILILTLNCFIVWFIYRVLRRERAESRAAPPEKEEREVLEVR